MQPQPDPTISEPRIGQNRPHTFKILLGFLVTAVCFAVALWGVDFKVVAESFGRAHYQTLPIYLVFLFLYFWLKAVRWRMLLKPLQELRTKDVSSPLMIGFMGNNLLPAHLGELIRVFLLAGRHRLSKSAVFSSVVLERLLDLSSILLLFGISLPFLESLPTEYERAAFWLTVLVMVALGGILLLIFWTEPFLRLGRNLLNQLPIRRVHRDGLLESLEFSTLGLSAIKQGGPATAIILNSLAQWSLMGLMVWISLWSFDISVSPLVACLVLTATALGVTIPSTPGFFGVIQLCFWISLSLFGIAKADAFAASVYYHMAGYIPVTLVGLYYLNRDGLSLKSLRRQA